MELSEAIGFIQFWGNTPAINFLEDEKGVSDIRHILHTFFYISGSEKFKEKELNVYFHETQKENIARALLFLHILNMTDVSYRERVECFFDIYANCQIKETNAELIQELGKELDRLLTDEAKSQMGIKQIVDTSQLKFKDKDDLLDIFRSWDKSVPYKIEEYRDHRLRHMFKEKFDYRLNFMDWDYQMNVKDQVLQVLSS